MKKGFLIYKSLYEPIRSFTREQKGELLEAIFEYQTGGEVPADISPIVNMAFLFFKNQFDIDNEKYVERCEKAKRSAEKRWNAKDANACERIPTNANDADKSNKKQETSNKTQETSKKIVKAKAPTLEDRKINFYLTVQNLLPEVQLSKSEAESFADYWTEHNAGGQKMLFEMKRTFDIKRRMKTWQKNESKFKGNDSSTGAQAVGTVTDFIAGM